MGVGPRPRSHWRSRTNRRLLGQERCVRRSDREIRSRLRGPNGTRPRRARQGNSSREIARALRNRRVSDPRWRLTICGPWRKPSESFSRTRQAPSGGSSLQPPASSAVHSLCFLQLYLRHANVVTMVAILLIPPLDEATYVL